VLKALEKRLRILDVVRELLSNADAELRFGASERRAFSRPHHFVCGFLDEDTKTICDANSAFSAMCS